MSNVHCVHVCMCACVLQTFCRLSQTCNALPISCRHSHHDNGIWYLFYMLKDSYLLQIYKRSKHGDTIQHFPDDDLPM